MSATINSSNLVLPVIEDLPYASLLAERKDLEIAIDAITRLEDMSRISSQVSLRALAERLEYVTRAQQAFEKVTYRQLRNLGA